MAEYYTKAESDARYAGTSHTHALEEIGGNNLPADRVEVPESVCGSFDNAFTMDEALASIADQLGGKAAANHSHTGYATASHTHSGYADASHSHTASEVGAAPASHTHTADDITGLPTPVDAYSKTESDARYAGASHSHGEYMTEDDAADAFADINHTHTGFAPAEHTHSAYSPVGHTHSNYADADHTHDYAAAGHSHSYNDLTDTPTIPTIPSSLPANGGNADTVDGKHASAFALSGHTHTAASVGAAADDHTHTPADIGAAASSHSHSAADVGALPATGGTISGALIVTGAGTIRGKAYTQQILPMDAGSYSIGASDNRYYSTYLRVNPNVSSDRRFKRDIAPMDIDALAAFVGKLSVVNYNYNDDAADEAKRIGLIAQDVVAADPTIAQGCIEQDEKGFYSLRAADLVFPLIAAVQALTKRVEELEGK